MRTARARAYRLASPSAGVALVLALLSSACGGAGGGQSGGGGGDWYYHWSCNGDGQCLATNPTGQPIGTVNEGPVYAMCSPLLEFAARNWGPAAWNQCDQSASFPRVLTRLEVVPGNATLAQGATQQYTATARYSDGSSADVTAQAAWSVVTTSGSGVASTAAGGLLTALAQGTATVTARLGSLSGTASLTVGPVAIAWLEVLPANPTVAKGQTQAFTGTAHWSDGHTTDVTATAGWFSQNTAVAAMSGAVATGRGAGTSTITAYAGGKSGTTVLTVTGPVLVSIAVRPDAPRIAAGTARQLTAIGTWSDSTAQDVTLDATWASSVTGVATIAAPGRVSAVAPGESAVTASLGDVSGLTTVTVTTATLQTLAVSPAEPTVGTGETLTFSAIGSFSDGTSYPVPAGVAWASSAPETVPVDPGGLATALALGTAGISASYDGVAGATTVTVTSSPPGTTWTWRASGITQAGTGIQYQLNAIVWTGSQLVAAGTAGVILTSPDGLAWTNHSTSTPYVRGLAYAPELGLLVAVGGDPTTGSVWTSPDGVTWTKALSSSQLAAVVWSGTLFVAVGSQQTGNALLYTSPDGVAWTQRSLPTAQVLVAVTWNGAEFVAVGNATVVSADGIHWTLSPDPSNALFGVAWSPKLARFVKVPNTGGQVRMSSDGLSWTLAATLPVSLSGVIWANNRFVAVGGSGSPAYVFTSTDGVSWNQGTLGGAGLLYGTSGTSWFRAVAWTGTRLVGVGDRVLPATASDGNYFIETSP